MKKSPEAAAEAGEVLGEDYTPPGRTGVFDVPSYDDVADLHQLFKRFANTAVSAKGDEMTGTYNLNGSLYINGQPVDPADNYYVVNETAAFTPGQVQILHRTRFMCFTETGFAVTMPDGKALNLPDGCRITIVQTGKGKITVSGPNYTGAVSTSGAFTQLEVMWHDGFWYGLAGGGGGGGGGEGTPGKPTIAFSPDFTKITWAPVTGTAGPTLGYGYLVTPEQGITCSLSGTTLTISSVTENTDFSFEVWAVNTAGRGESSTAISHTWTGLAAPAITATGAPAAINVSWGAVSGATSYVVSYKKKSDTNWTTKDVGAVTSYQISGLLEQVPFQVYAQAKKLNVVSPMSNVAEATPGPGIPDQIVMSHRGVRAWKIDNYVQTNVYKVVSGPQITIDANGNVTMAGNGQTYMTYARVEGGPTKGYYFESRAYEYHQECRPQTCYNPCGNCRTDVDPHTWSCGCGSPCGNAASGSGGDCICFGPDICEQVKNATPGGYNDSEGEWWRKSDAPMMELKDYEPWAGSADLTLADGRLSGRIPLGTYEPFDRDDFLKAPIRSALLAVTDDGGNVLAVFSADVDMNYFATEWYEEHLRYEMKVDITDLTWVGRPSPSKFRFLTQSPHQGADAHPHVVHDIEGPVK